MKTARQWMPNAGQDGHGHVWADEDYVREIQKDAMRGGLEAAIERMKDFWGHDIIRAVARELAAKNDLPVPEVPVCPTRNPPTPSEVPPPKVHQNWGNAPVPGPTQADWEKVRTQSPPPANPPPKDCFADPKPLEPKPEPTSLSPERAERQLAETMQAVREELKQMRQAKAPKSDPGSLTPWEESVVNFLGRHQKRLDVLEQARELKQWQTWVEQRLNELEADLKRSTPAPPTFPPGPPVAWSGVRGAVKGTKVKVHLEWTGSQWLEIAPPLEY